jgi:hypothetical protein
VIVEVIEDAIAAATAAALPIRGGVGEASGWSSSRTARWRWRGPIQSFGLQLDLPEHLRESVGQASASC